MCSSLKGFSKTNYNIVNILSNAFLSLKKSIQIEASIQPALIHAFVIIL
jgi:hypothetical protein